MCSQDLTLKLLALMFHSSYSAIASREAHSIIADTLIAHFKVHLHTHSLTRSLTYSPTHAHSFTHSLSHSFTHSLIHSLTRLSLITRSSLTRSSLTRSSLTRSSLTRSLIYSLIYSLILAELSSFNSTTGDWNQQPKFTPQKHATKGLCNALQHYYALLCCTG